jgi:hypothetical protein
MELQLKITGVLLIALALIHAFFPNRFNWKAELAPLSLLNRQMMYVHTAFVALTVLLMGMLCLFCTYDIMHTNLGHKLALGFFLFWLTRLVVQFFVYSTELWKGKLFETIIHVVFAILWTYLSAVFLLIYLNAQG